MGWFHYGKTTKKLGKGISVDFRHFLVIFEALWDPPRAPRVPKMENSMPWEVETEHFTMRWFHFEKNVCYSHWRWTNDKGKWFETCFGHFQALRALPRPPEGPQLFQMDNLVFHENLRRDILQWEDFTMGTPGDIYMESGQRIVWWFEAYFSCFWFLKGALKGPGGSLMYPNGWPSVP